MNMTVRFQNKVEIVLGTIDAAGHDKVDVNFISGPSAIYRGNSKACAAHCRIGPSVVL